MDLNKILDGIIKELKKLFTSKENKVEKSKNNKLPNFLIACLSIVLIGILVVIGTDYFKSTSTAKINTEANVVSVKTNTSTEDYETAAENKLKSVLEDMKGVGKTKVMITVEGSEEQIPAVNINDSTSITKERDDAGGTRDTTQKNSGSTIVVTNDGVKNQPLIVQTKKPKIIGVCVIAEGAKDKVVQLQITQVVTRLYNLTSDKVSVYPMEN
ncbi:stage III sporulation protein AG [Clostridium sp. SYSU_GA19001]|uniref:stage III sporulation protein AG n=1 Tax=Clostridium caldaquaticum TaxID=2940653 RepID=UPI0020771180|nr:stage III sporulation protein AG [Clostridium caldaquaticum]MCM8711042.1 stage III sporulation protein AG [Clostridium caldaquaticum]